MFFKISAINQSFMKVRGPEGKLQVAVALLVSFGLIGYGGYSYMDQSSALSSSVSVNATIDSVGVEEVDGRRGSVEYRPEASFTYSVNGTEYTSSNVYPGNLAPSFDTEEEASLEYEQGDSVTAYVEEGSPSNAFLKHESSNRPLYLIGFGFMMIAVTAYTGFYR